MKKFISVQDIHTSITSIFEFPLLEPQQKPREKDALYWKVFSEHRIEVPSVLFYFIWFTIWLCIFSGIRDSPILKSNTELENRSVAAERRVGHMALLLSEFEAENARLNELANVLKEVLYWFV